MKLLRILIGNRTDNIVCILCLLFVSSDSHRCYMHINNICHIRNDERAGTARVTYSLSSIILVTIWLKIVTMVHFGHTFYLLLHT